MPPGWRAVFLVGVAVVLVGAELEVVDDSNWWESCKNPVCSVAENQAEGLARLRVLSNYIKETMVLMGTVVDSLDNEMLEVREELRDVVGRRCHSRGHAALNTVVTHSTSPNEAESSESQEFEVITDGNNSWTSGSGITQESTSAWGTEVSQSTSQVPSSSTSQIASSSTSQVYSSTTAQGTLPATPYVSPQPPSTTTSQRTVKPVTTTKVVSWRGTHQYPGSSSSRGSTYDRPSSTLKRYEEESEEDENIAPALPDTNPWQGGRGGGRGGRGGGGGGRGGGRWGHHGQGRGGGHGRGNVHGGGRGHGHGRYWSDGASSSFALGSSGCKGVPVGSPSYVPGLDSWCASNCPAGNCPATHCICP